MASLKELREQYLQKKPEFNLIGYDSDFVANEVVKQSQIIAERIKAERLAKTKPLAPIKTIKKEGYPKLSKKQIHIKNKVLCCYCDCQLSDGNFTWEHLVPKILKGNNREINKRPACSRCNTEKGGKTMLEYIEFLQTVPQNERVKKAIENANALLKYVNEYGTLLYRL